MSDRLTFREKLSGIVTFAKEQGHVMTQEQVEQYFEEERLSEEQVELVYDYLLSQKIAVKGYEKKPGLILEKENEVPKMSAEERAYLEEYVGELRSTQMNEGAMKEYLLKVAELAEQFYHPEIFVGDLIQEGNVSLMMALEQYPDAEEAHIMGEVRTGLQMAIESQTETKLRDNRVVAQVAELDGKIKALTEEMGRKASVDEVAQHTGMSEEEVLDVLRLAGEDVPEEELS